MASVVAQPELTQSQWDQLAQDGFIITPVLFDDETLAGVRSEFKRLWDEHKDAANQSGDPLSIQQARDRAFFSRLNHRSEVCRAFCHHPVFQQLARQIVGPDVDMTWNQAIIKRPTPAVDNAFAWHQDMWYALNGDYAKDADRELLCDPLLGITAWVAITRTTVDNGTLWVLPGRHMEGLLPHIWSAERREWQGQFDTSWKLPAVLRPGQMILFRKYLPHGSGPNISNEDRMAYQISYCSPGAKPATSLDISPVLRGGNPA